MNLANKRIILSKINHIGDVLFALPLASVIKQMEPTAHVIFLGKDYTQDLIEHYQDVDEFVSWDDIYKEEDLDRAAEHMRALNADIIVHVMANRPSDLVCRVAKKAKIPVRIGTSRRLYTLQTCNRFMNISRSKNKLDLHEAQYDMMFLKKLGGKRYYSKEEIINLLNFKPFNKNAECLNLLDDNRFNLILHPKSKGQTIEWKPEQFGELIAMLPQDKFNIFVTGSAAEGDMVRDKMLTPFPHVIDLCGKISLNHLMQFIQNANGMICASTGPVHLAANFGINTLGLYAPIKPFHANRWGPIGPKAEVLCVKKACEACRHAMPCKCIWDNTPKQVFDVVQRWYSEWQVKNTRQTAVKLETLLSD